MASTAMVALEATIVATAMPNIVADLGGLNLYSWVFASFLLAQTATTVVFGKLADVRGRKPVMLSGIAVFIVASVLAGFSTSMTWMIVFRLAQGFGAGAIVPVAMTLVGDMYRPAERGKDMTFACIFAVSLLVLVSMLLLPKIELASVTGARASREAR